MIDPTCPEYTNPPGSQQQPAFDYFPDEASPRPCATIITPFYNTGPVFHETARSVLRQSLQQWEWVIINDGSTESESLTILDHYRRSDPRIRVIDHGANKGLSAARNTGFHAAQTPYVVQLDSDDLLEPTAVEKWVWFLASYPEVAFVKGYSVGFGAQAYLWEKGFHNGSAFLEDNLVDATCAIRTAVHRAVGGSDETIREGLEDWDFWLRCANAGYWGGTIPEYLNWYRRRDSHGDRWANWDNAERVQAFRTQLRQQYPKLWNGGFPQIQQRGPLSHDTVSDALPWENRLQKKKPRLLMIVPWLTFGGADKFNLDLAEQLTRRGWELSIATTLQGNNPWLSLFSRYTPDIFILSHFLRLVDYPRFFQYLLQSRQVDAVLISNSELGYALLPYLRAHCPKVAFLDFCHMEEEHWKSGGYPRLAVTHQELLDLNVVASEHLKHWMEEHGLNSTRGRVCYINIDTEQWRPDPVQRKRVRKELAIGDTLPVVLYAGRICAQKQPRVFAQTMLSLRQKSVSCLALVAGDGPDLEWLRTFVKRNGLSDQVCLLGMVANERVRDLLQAADIFFLPSEWEGIALSIYEAMALSLPIVGADVGGQRELVTSDCGILIQRRDEETEVKNYVDALTALLCDQQRRQQMGKAGRERVKTYFRLEQMGERMVVLLQEAMQLHEHSPRDLPTQSLGRLFAAQAIECARLSAVADGLWRERTQAQDGPLGLHPHLLDPHSDSWRTLAYFALRRFLLPAYRAARDKNTSWLVPLKDKCKQILLRGHHS